MSDKRKRLLVWGGGALLFIANANDIYLFFSETVPKVAGTMTSEFQLQLPSFDALWPALRVILTVAGVLLLAYVVIDGRRQQEKLITAKRAFSPRATPEPSVREWGIHGEVKPAPVVIAPVSSPASPPIPNGPPKGAQTHERVIADVTPEFLFGRFKDRTDIQAMPDVIPHIGEWMRVHGPVGSVGDFNEHFSQVTFADRSLGDMVFMYFRDRSLKDRLGMLRKGDAVTVLGRIDKITRASIDLEECELVDWQPAIPPTDGAA